MTISLPTLEMENDMSNDTPQIENNIPIPTYGQGPNKYHWRKLEVGDSRLYPGFTATNCSPVSAAYAWGKCNNKTFTARTVEGGVRIWRIK